MRQIIIFIVALFLFGAIKANAQIKPAQSQYFKEKGVFVNPGFEQGYKGWTITGCSKSLVTEIPFMGKSLQLSCSGESFSIKQETTALAGSNLDAFAGCRVKASASGVAYRTLEDGAQLTASAVAAGDFKRFEEDFTAGATSNGVEIYSISTYTGTVIVEDCFTGTTPDGYLADVFPDQTGNALKALSTNGTNPLWRIAERLNAQTKDNLLTNPSFENGSPDGTVTVGSGIDLSGSTTRTSQESPHNASRFSITGSASDTIEYKYASTEDFTGSQMVAFCEYRTTRPSTFFRVYSGGVLQGERLLETDDIWRYVSIPFSGGANPEFSISGDSATTEEISIDNCFIGKQNPNAVQTISDAHHVGTIFLNSNCTYDRDNTAYGKMVDSAACDASQIDGGLSMPTNSLEAGLIIDNKRTDGVYKIEYQGLLYNLGITTSYCEFTLSKTGSDGIYPEIYLAPDAGGSYKSEGQINATMRFTESDTGEVFLLAHNGSTPNNCRAYGTSSDRASWNVHFYPDDTVSAVTAESLSPDKAGFLIWSVFDGNIEGHLKADGSCVKASDYPDYAKNVGSTYGVCTVDTANDGFLLPDVVGANRFIRAAGGSLAVGTAQADATAVNGLNIPISGAHSHTLRGEYSSSNGPYSRSSADASGQQTISTFTNGAHSHSLAGDTETRPISIAFVPFIRMHDRNRVLGTFDQVEEVDGELDKFSANTLTAVIDGVTCAVDSENITGWVDTAIKPATGRCQITFPNLGLTNTPAFNVSIQFSGGYHIETTSNGSNTSIVMWTVNASFAPSDSVKYYVSLNKQGSDFNKTVKGVVINASKYKELCQRKDLTANVSTGGDVTDLQFNNLTVGKKYSITTQVRCVIGDNNCRLSARYLSSGGYIATTQNQPTSAGPEDRYTQTFHNPIFTAKETTIRHTLTLGSGFLEAVAGENNLGLNTFSILCELRADNIETTKFD